MLCANLDFTVSVGRCAWVVIGVFLHAFSYVQRWLRLVPNVLPHVFAYV